MGWDELLSYLLERAVVSGIASCAAWCPQLPGRPTSACRDRPCHCTRLHL